MPKGRGSKRLKSKRKASPSGRPSSKGSRPKGVVGQREAAAREIRQRQQAAEAGGATRAERKKTRQREQEAARVAARKLVKAVKEE